MGRKRLSADEHHRRGTFQPSRHGEKAALLGIDEADTSTWFRHHSPAEQHLWRQYLKAYIPGDRLPCYRFIAHWAACESVDYWRTQRGDPPPTAWARTTRAKTLADLFAATKGRRR
jgi:hypothetical protein